MTDLTGKGQGIRIRRVAVRRLRHGACHVIARRRPLSKANDVARCENIARHLGFVWPNAFLPFGLGHHANHHTQPRVVASIVIRKPHALITRLGQKVGRLMVHINGAHRGVVARMLSVEGELLSPIRVLCVDMKEVSDRCKTAGRAVGVSEGEPAEDLPARVGDAAVFESERMLLLRQRMVTRDIEVSAVRIHGVNPGASPRRIGAEDHGRRMSLTRRGERDSAVRQKCRAGIKSPLFMR